MTIKVPPKDTLPERSKQRVKRTIEGAADKPALESIWGGLHAGAANFVDAANTFFYGKGAQITIGLVRGLAIGALAGLVVGLALSYIPLLHGIPFILTGTQTINVSAIVSTAVGLGAAIGAPVSAVKSYFYAEEHYSEKMGKIAGNKVAIKGKILGRDKPLDHFTVHESEALSAPLRLNPTTTKAASSEPAEVHAEYLSNAPSYREKVRDDREQTMSEQQSFIS